MPTLEWLHQEFEYGYSSGDVLAPLPDPVRLLEELRIGGSYRTVFVQGALPHLRPDCKVMELGPGRGSWTRALLKMVTQGEVHTLDFQDVSPWLEPGTHGGRLVCHRVSDNSFSAVEDGAFDFFWSFGVLCHNNQDHIREILARSLSKMKKGGIAVHQYADWNKLDAFGWEKGSVPEAFRNMRDDEIWWPRNDQASMVRIAEEAGWEVVTADLNLVQRDSIIVLKRS